ncbi:pyridoxal phosphate-dependent transferase [Macrophomina phaseolina]|uniref:Pyridoxal phosphate-dependent transferase n=1 Tax=Macrophomina phaseolina TaxID=35725 RepID=A0ABQ8GIJ1_9PEZI|nr:pyridoxal phosphate-dependent transferase [Macrophomina phaseolina]
MAGQVFGRTLRAEHFLFRDGFVNLNHGSLGTHPRSVRRRLRELQDMAEAAPDHFRLYDFPRLLHESRAAMAAHLRVPIDELIFVPSTPTLIDAVLRSLHFQPGDLIVYFDTAHEDTKAVITRTVQTSPAGALPLHIAYPITDREIIQLFRTTLAAHPGRVKLAFFETISTLPAATLPFESLAETARGEGVLTFVDGAHGVGHLPLDLESLKPDFFVADCHKWLFVPRPCTAFYSPRRHHQKFRDAKLCRYLAQEPATLSASTSHCAQPSPGPPAEPASNARLVEPQYETLDRLVSFPCLCIPEALRFREMTCGGEAEVMGYCARLSRKMASRVASILFTSSMEGDFVRRCCMFNVMLPLRLAGDVAGQHDEPMKQMVASMAPVPSEQAAGVTKYLTERLLEEHHVSIAIYIYRSVWWARFSTQVYLQEDDFELGARALKSICLEVREGKHLN